MNTNAADARNRILRPKQVAEILGVHRSTLGRWVDREQFPKPIQMGVSAIGWPQWMVDQWVQKRVQEARAQVDDAGTLQ